VAGDFVHVPRGIRHRFKNKTAHTARMIFMFTPGGPEEVFLRYSDPARPGEQPPPLGPDQLERYLETARLTSTDNLPGSPVTPSPNTRHPFRFGVSMLATGPQPDWQAKARLAADLGYDILQVADHRACSTSPR
jgi:hypothetical protein